ncbi:DUF3160 domain-containing protein [Candidatus Woesebacteria bacterium]|nr:MAG: DUF3160 domain-containing protein [Candidatus Woesebacteria bacterium]
MDEGIPPVNQISDNPQNTENINGEQSVFNKTDPVAHTPKTKPITLKRVLLAISILVAIGLFTITHLAKNRADSTNNLDTKHSFRITSPGVFAEYKEIKSTIKPSLPAYTISVPEITNLSEVSQSGGFQIDENLTSQLTRNGFFIKPTQITYSDPETPIFEPRSGNGNRVDDMIDIYMKVGGSTSQYDRQPENAVFITSDLLLHTYHVLIDRTFQKIEETKMHSKLHTLTKALYESSIVSYKENKDSELTSSLSRITTYYLIPLVILDTSNTENKTMYFETVEEQQSALETDESVDTKERMLTNLEKYKNDVPDEIYSLAEKELNLIFDAQAPSESPLFGKFTPDLLEDYTQYTPRGHYTKNSTLRSYFRAMMWYGRRNFELRNEFLTQDAAIIAWQLGHVDYDKTRASSLWEDIYLPTVFFVGQSDDLTYYQYSDLVNEVYGDSVKLTDFKDLAKLEILRQKAQLLAGPKILSEIKTFDPLQAPTKDELLQSTKGFRFMGQRFIPDSYMFSELTQGDEKPDETTGQYLPSTPTSLMVMSILGNKTADPLLDDWVKENAPDSDRVIAQVQNKLKGEFLSLDEKTWTQNIYWAWLYNFMPLFEEHGDGYPGFMRNYAWNKKSLNTVLGSWTELRHDTLLYAKQSYAEMGGGPEEGEIPPVPKGYVEPDLSFITRLIALNKMTLEGLDDNDLLIDGMKQKFENFDKALNFFKEIAEKELTDQKISDEEFEKLRNYVTYNFPNIVWSLDGDIMREKDARMGIVADVHTDATKNQILYEATGTPMIIYVAVKDTNGTRLTRGAVYSYYEFTQPLERRLTDEKWQEIVYEGKEQLPPTPSWVTDIITP